MKIRTIKVFQPVHVSNIIHVPDHGKRKEGGVALAHYRHATSRCDTCALQTQLGVITVARVLPHAALSHRANLWAIKNAYALSSRDGPQWVHCTTAVKLA